MGLPAKETPTKHCEWCGTPFTRKRVGKAKQLECVSNFLRRRFCSISCSVSRQHATEPPSVAASRKRAHKKQIGSCGACDSEAEICVHHINGNPLDNSPQNLQTLCLPCHSFWHAMLRRTSRQSLAPMPRLVEWANCAPTAMPSSRPSRLRSSEPSLSVSS